MKKALLFALAVLAATSVSARSVVGNNAPAQGGLGAVPQSQPFIPGQGSRGMMPQSQPFIPGQGSRGMTPQSQPFIPGQGLTAPIKPKSQPFIPGEGPPPKG